MNENSSITGTKYCIFRVGEKYKTINSIKGFEGHMERTFNTPNANISNRSKNKILIGDKNILENVQEYIQDIKLRKNGVLARDLLLTASPEFFRERSKQDVEHWINVNIDFLKQHFGDNIRYAVVHRDELTPHIHCLLVPKFLDQKRNKYKLSNNKYFDGRDKLSEWQDKYAEFINSEYKELKRGTKGSKAQHVKIKQYYTLVNASLDSKDLKSVLAKASNSELLEKQIKTLQATLKLYKDKCIDKDKKANIERNRALEIEKNLKELKRDKEVYKQTIRAISETYYISQQSILNIVKSIEQGINVERDRSK